MNRKNLSTSIKQVKSKLPPDKSNVRLKWKGNSEFKTKNFTFSCSLVDYSGVTNGQSVTLLKDRGFIESYLEFLAELKPKRVFELGFFQGGMPLFLSEVCKLEKVIAIDWHPPTPELLNLVTRHKLQKKLEFVGGVDQLDATRVKSIAKTGFNGKPIDLIIDDCSHYYENTKGCFEQLFGMLRPGGAYVIEDWGWTHWPSEPWNTSKSHFHGMPSMTNLMFKIIMAFGSTQGIIERIEFPSIYTMVIYRGKNLPHGEPFVLEKHIKVHGNRIARLITES